jgi:ribonuclease P protein component
VQRNLLRRRLKEIIRTEYLNKIGNWDMVFIVRPELLKKDFAELKDIVRLTLEKAKLI